MIDLFKKWGSFIKYYFIGKLVLFILFTVIKNVSGFISLTVGNFLNFGWSNQTIEIMINPQLEQAKTIELLKISAKYPPNSEPNGIAIALKLYVTELILPYMLFGMMD